MDHPMIPTQEKIMSLILGMEILQIQRVMEQTMIMGLIYHVRFVHILTILVEIDAKCVIVHYDLLKSIIYQLNTMMIFYVYY